MGRILEEAGTFALVFVLPSGLVSIGIAIAFAYRPTARKRDTANALVRMALYSGLAGFVAGMIGVSEATFKASEKPEISTHGWWQILIEGTGEACNNLLLAFGLIALSCLFLAVGEARNKAL